MTEDEKRRIRELILYDPDLWQSNLNNYKGTDTYTELLEGYRKQAEEAGILNEFIAKYEKYLSDNETVEAWKNGNKQEKRKPNLVSFQSIEEKEAEWIIPGYIPKGQITLLAGDGGVGKTSVWCNIAAAVSAGKQCLLDSTFPEEWEKRAPGKVIVFSAEDTPEYTLKRKLRICGADLGNIHTVLIQDPAFKNIKFQSEDLRCIVEDHKPMLLVFDPIQAFLPVNVRMAERNAIRQNVEPLISFGSELGVTTILVVHSNKQSDAWGRKRISDSSDIWDSSRSVLMLGEVPGSDGLRYISHEKSNIGFLQDTILFTNNDGVPKFEGTSLKKDRDYILANKIEYGKGKRENTKKEDAKQIILNALADRELLNEELVALCKDVNISESTVKNARTELLKNNQIKSRVEGSKKFHKVLYSLPTFKTLSSIDLC